MDEWTAWLQDREIKGDLRRLRPLASRRGGRLGLVGPEQPAGDLLDFSSNDYLALSEHPAVVAGACRALREWGTGAGAARLMSGDLLLGRQLEVEVARLKGKEAALVFGSGYLANLGVISALVSRGDVIFSDRLNHASILDGCRLSGARLLRFRHNEPAHLEELLRKERGRGRALIVVESLYSMDGDRSPLADVIELKERYGCLLLVDEAHATGVFGPNGGGLVEEQGVGAGVDLVMGTFGKALGSYGAYVAATNSMVEYLLNRSRSFIYTTSLPPATLGASLAALELVRSAPELRAELHAKAELFKAELRNGGLDGLGSSQIVPLVIGDSARAVRLAAVLERSGLFVAAVRPPTVPANTARLRFSVTRHHSFDTLRKSASLVLKAFKSCAPELL